MKLIGLTKIRNESEIIQNTLDHWGKICTGGIYVYDDVSEDNTVAICEAHKSVKKVIRGKYWDVDRERSDFMTRQDVLVTAKMDANDDDWFVYFDADERMYFDDWDLLFNKSVKAIACRLYDIYITPEDVNKKYLERDFVGPEYRTIVFFFRNSPYLSYDKPDQRQVNLEPGINIPVAGIVKHFGKGISIDHWEKTVDYYVNFWPKYASKWEKRRGKAVKKDYKSDFGNKLISFNAVLRKDIIGIPLESQVYGKN